jgi:YebC/PmpR family DNA-binding regulatory protein
MSGHSKWATIKHKKAALDAKRGRSFTRLIKEIAIAARAGGDPDGNPRLRTAVNAAKAASMPADNIKRAIMRGTGQLEGATIDEVTFEGYGPGGVAVLVEVATDNRNRTVSEIRHLFGKNGGNLGEAGCVAWLFHKRSLIVVPKEKMGEDQLMELALNAGADDLKDEGENWFILSPPDAHAPKAQSLSMVRAVHDDSDLMPIGDSAKAANVGAEPAKLATGLLALPRSDSRVSCLWRGEPTPFLPGRSYDPSPLLFGVSSPQRR